MRDALEAQGGSVISMASLESNMKPGSSRGGSRKKLVRQPL